jgi:hypothetical protein
METTLGSTPKMDWESGDLPTAWKSFKQHVQFMLDGLGFTPEDDLVTQHFIFLLIITMFD